MKIFKGMGTIFKRTFKEWNAADPFRQSAVIAYYAIFSLPALLVLVINVAGFFFERQKVSGEISRQIGDVMGSDTAGAIESIVAKTGETDAGIISTIIAFATIIFGATGVFIQLQKSLNAVWNVRQKPDVGFMIELKHRLFSFGLIITIGFLLLMSLVISSVLAATSNYLQAILPDFVTYLFVAIEFVVSLAVVSTLFLLMFKFLPDVKNRWKPLIPGAVLTGLLFMLGKYALSLYFGKAEPASVYGAAGSIVLVLLWSSYSSMIVFFGAEFTQQYAVYHGYAAPPTPVAERIDSDALPEGDPPTAEKKQAPPATKNTTQKASEKPDVLQVKNLRELDDEIARMEARAAVQMVNIKRDFHPAKVVKDILEKKKTIPRPENKELSMEGFDFAINYMADKVLFKNASPAVRSVAVYVMRELARNYVYGPPESWPEHLRELLHMRESERQMEEEAKKDEDIEGYFDNI